MGSVKSYLAKIFASNVSRKINSWASKPMETQQQVFDSLIKIAKNTEFGQDHQFSSIETHNDFVKNVPVRDYEALKPYAVSYTHLTLPTILLV